MVWMMLTLACGLPAELPLGAELPDVFEASSAARPQEVPGGVSPPTGAVATEQSPIGLPTKAPEITLPPAPSEACAGAVAPQPCATRLARKAAARGDATGAAAECLALPTPRWREECHFSAAEAAVRLKRTDSYKNALLLCASAGEFRSNCYWHTGMAMSGAAPAADAPGAAPWGQTREAVDEVRAAWDVEDEDFGEAVVQVVWGRALSEAMAVATTLDGTAVDVLPSDALPHLRAALAAESLRRDGAEKRDLATWVAELERRLGARTLEAEPGQGPNRRMGVSSKVDLWGEGGDWPSVVYLGGSRRAVDPDQSVDLAICVLEGAARMEPPDAALIGQGLDHEAAVVRWTAERLLATPPGQGP